MNDPLAFLRRIMREPDQPAASADIPTLTQVAAAEPAPAGPKEPQDTAQIIDNLVAEYLPIIEHELRRRLREQLVAQED